MDKRIPVTLLTGFLGSGKTTLLNKLLHNPAMKDTAVIINELGEAGLDQIFANSQISQTIESEHIADNTVLLSSGCLCCSLKNELADTMRDLFFKRSLQAVPEFNRLVIETTGMADPGPILANLMNEPVIESVYRLDAVVVTIDAAYGLQQITEQKEALKQAAVADVLLITKRDTATPEQIEALQAKLSEINPNATQQFVLHGEIDPMQIIDVGLFDFASKQANPQRWLRAPASGFSAAKKSTLPKAPAHDDVNTFTVYLPKPMAWSNFKSVILKLCQTHGEKLLRMKGILHVEDAPAPLAIHAVHFTPYPPTLLEGWDEDEPISRIVIIGKGIDENAVRDMLTQF
ncbi:CobW family GTP-binding protein [Methylophilus methylotrophus]|uniref:CobW family GTP-binding protein n=1 Tax=Methylophilus methylotrophus TaxID=17 RepID=UPI0003789A4B|nr:GTP-binding protein [Methylophilus methylotrophus]